MSNKTQNLLSIMNVLSWIAFIGLLIKAGAILISYSVSLANPEGAKNLYMGLNLFKVKQFNFWHYTIAIAFKVILTILEAYIAFLMIKVLSKIKMTNPFTMEVARLLERISFFILGTWAMTMFNNFHTNWLLQRIPGLQLNLISEEFVFLAAVVFVMAQIFKKGVEIQSENELTV